MARNPIRHAKAVAFAEAQRLHWRQLHDVAVLVEHHRDPALAAEHALRPELAVEHVEMPHAVEQRNDGGLRSHRRREGRDRVVEIERLAAEQHRIEFFAQRVGLHRRRVFQRGVAERALDHEAVAGELRGTPRPDQEGHVASGRQHPAAEIAADRAGTDHEHSHC